MRKNQTSIYPPDKILNAINELGEKERRNLANMIVILLEEALTTRGIETK